MNTNASLFTKTSSLNNMASPSPHTIESLAQEAIENSPTPPLHQETKGVSLLDLDLPIFKTKTKRAMTWKDVRSALSQISSPAHHISVCAHISPAQPEFFCAVIPTQWMYDPPAAENCTPFFGADDSSPMFMCNTCYARAWLTFDAEKGLLVLQIRKCYDGTDAGMKEARDWA